MADPFVYASRTRGIVQRRCNKFSYRFRETHMLHNEVTAGASYVKFTARHVDI